MTPDDRAWLAGLLEGEGCFGMAHSPFVLLHMTDKDVVERAAWLMDTTVFVAKEPAERRQRLFGARVFGDRAVHVMTTVRGLLGDRRGRKVDSVLAARHVQMTRLVTAVCRGCTGSFTRPPGGPGRGAPRRYCATCRPR